MLIDIEELKQKNPILKELSAAKEIVWINPKKQAFQDTISRSELSLTDINDAEKRLLRFAPLIMKLFPETSDRKGLIESNLVPIPGMQEELNRKYHGQLSGRLLLKQDSHLAVAGSIKARGGIYEVLKHTEDLALANKIIKITDCYDKLAESKEFFNEYTIQVGSTGNLGLSIGIIGAAIGYKMIVHMSTEAKQWKKDLLREHGVTVMEYASDYSAAVSQGRKLSAENPKSYFVDDENSKNLFLGYAVAAKRLKDQLEELDIPVDADHPLFTYIPCGVGGAPGGVSFGLKQMFGDHVHCFFVEPTQAPCMLLGMASGLQNSICVQDIGLTGSTHADGLAVGRPSGFVGKVMSPHLSGEFTVSDARLYDYMRDLLDTENIFLEPSACACFQGPVRLNQDLSCNEYLMRNNLIEKMENATHIAWATGGSLVPEEQRELYKNTRLD